MSTNSIFGVAVDAITVIHNGPTEKQALEHSSTSVAGFYACYCETFCVTQTPCCSLCDSLTLCCSLYDPLPVSVPIVCVRDLGRQFCVRDTRQNSKVSSFNLILRSRSIFISRSSTSSKIAALEAKLKQMEEGAGNGGPFTKGKRISTSLKIQQASRSRTSTGPKRLGFRGGHGRRLPIRH